MSTERRYRPVERYWPYVEKPEEPTAEELAALDPDLHATLFGPRELPFSITLVFPRFDGENFERALVKAQASAEFREIGEGDALRYRARFFSNNALGLRDLFELVGPVPGTEVLLDDRPVPYSRELWLPLARLRDQDRKRAMAMAKNVIPDDRGPKDNLDDEVYRYATRTGSA